ncbi:MAG: adenylyl-sulfate kinase [Chloroflexi bacterium]|nr:MAG: adenylyl-sulfate kinase [Chloroflexota bacterium]
MGSDPADLGATRVATLDADGLDLLELVLLGAAPLTTLLRTLNAEESISPLIQLNDGENTPLAHISGDTIFPLQPLARGVGPQWNAELRRSVHDVQREVAALGGGAIALAVHTPPSTSEIERAVEAVRATGANVLLIAALISRTAPVNDSAVRRVGGAGVVRSVVAAATDLSSRLSDVRVIPLIIPWPLKPGGPSADEEEVASQILKQYGAGTTIFGGDQNMLSETELAELLPPASRAEVERVRSDRSVRPAVVLFTGLSGSGKSTIARAVAERLQDDGAANVVLLDGDEMRRRISQDLGFDRASRNKNVERIAEAAALIASQGGVAIAAPIAPFTEGRARAREITAAAAPYLLVYISTPLEVCESRDRKGLYAKARTGEVKEFTGISSPYEAPTDADLVIDASVVPVERAVDQVLELLGRRIART